jgi:hypothetical protein
MFIKHVLGFPFSSLLGGTRGVMMWCGGTYSFYKKSKYFSSGAL